MIDARFRPLDQWYGKLLRKPAPFRRGWAACLMLLERELKHLGAHSIVVEAGFDERDIRLDGWPRSGATARHPGVVLYFQSRRLAGPVRMPCGTYSKWQDNLLAIGLTLERLRAIERYGATQEHQQYAGFKALPPYREQSATMGRDQAVRFICLHSGMTVQHRDAESVQAAYRRAAAKLHPDSPTGNHELFVRLQEAKDILDQQ